MLGIDGTHHTSRSPDLQHRMFRMLRSIGESPRDKRLPLPPEAGDLVLFPCSDPPAAAASWAVAPPPAHWRAAARRRRGRAAERGSWSAASFHRVRVLGGGDARPVERLGLARRAASSSERDLRLPRRRRPAGPPPAARRAAAAHSGLEEGGPARRPPTGRSRRADARRERRAVGGGGAPRVAGGGARGGARDCTRGGGGARRHDVVPRRRSGSGAARRRRRSGAARRREARGTVASVRGRCAGARDAARAVAGRGGWRYGDTWPAPRAVDARCAGPGLGGRRRAPVCVARRRRRGAGGCRRCARSTAAARAGGAATARRRPCRCRAAMSACCGCPCTRRCVARRPRRESREQCGHSTRSSASSRHCSPGLLGARLDGGAQLERPPPPQLPPRAPPSRRPSAPRASTAAASRPPPRHRIADVERRRLHARARTRRCACRAARA